MSEDGDIDASVKTALKRDLQLGVSVESAMPKAADTLRSLPSMTEFVLRQPLYEKFAVDLLHATFLRLTVASSKIDGHCIACRKDTTFQVAPPFLNYSMPHALDELSKQAKGFAKIQATCARNGNHKLIVFLHIADGFVVKVGQWPSLADILLDELKPLRSALSREDGAELHKAIGLAAHGVGVGSYVYLRRVLERLISKTYDANKDAVGIVKEDFHRLRMPDKIETLRNYLPPFLVQHGEIYGQLSDGIHNLSEDACLGYFDILKGAVFMMLKQESTRRAEAKAEDELSRAIGALRRSDKPGK
jgi:hypothetical protein